MTTVMLHPLFADYRDLRSHCRKETAFLDSLQGLLLPFDQYIARMDQHCADVERLRGLEDTLGLPYTFPLG